MRIAGVNLTVIFHLLHRNFIMKSVLPTPNAAIKIIIPVLIALAAYETVVSPMINKNRS